MTLTEGIHFGIHESIYHADPCPQPSLSHSIIKMLLKSPRHAWHAHPRLNTWQEPQDPSSAMEEGTALHAMCLGVGAKIVEIDAPDWRTKAAKEARDDARTAGKVPLLSWRAAEIERVAGAMREQLASHHDAAQALDNGDPEVPIIWREGDVWCRALVDWLPRHPRGWVTDLKFTGSSAGPDEWQRTLEREYATQAAWYLRGLRALGRDPAGFRFVVTETAAPYCMAVYACAPSLLAAAEADIEQAIAIWRRCLANDTWPGYLPHTMHVEASAWRAARADERQLSAEMAAFEETHA